MCTGKLEEVRAKLSGSSKEFIFLNAFLSAGGILYKHLFSSYLNTCPAILFRARRARDLEIRQTRIITMRVIVCDSKG